MEGDGEQGPDAASIKPVSSLRAKFENLRNTSTTDHDVHVLKHPPTPSGLRPVDSTKPSSLTRASLDLPRPHSPWQQLHEALEGHHAPRTPGPPSRGSESPTRSNHKRPMSLYLGSSPKLTPSVNVESPTSPPKPLFARTHSRSPERIDNGSIVRLRDLVSHHSNSSTRQSSPSAPQRTDSNSPAKPDDTSSSGTVPPTRPKSPMPPPINRADKPKVPAKPRGISPSADLGLVATGPSSLGQRKVSPFNTPPSSDEEDNAIQGHKTQSVSPRPIDAPDRKPSLVSATVSANTDSPRPRVDPRFMGFSAPKTPVERSDPRQLGFSTAQPPSQPSRELKSIPTPIRTTTLPVVPSRDARSLGFGASPSVTREPAPLPVTERSLPPRLDTVSRANPVRDPRFLGFSNSPNTPVDSPRQELPPRAVPKLPPPRPSEDSKRPVYVPGIARATPSVAPQPVSSTQARKSQDLPVPESRELPRHSIADPVDVKYPPPPRRGIPHEDEPRKATSLSIPSRQPTLVSRKSFDMHDKQSADSGPSTPVGRRPSATSGLGQSETHDTSVVAGRRSLDVRGGQPDSDAEASMQRKSLDMRNGRQVSGTATPPDRGGSYTGRGYDSDEVEGMASEPANIRQEYPDGSQSNRRPPIADPDKWSIHTRTDGKAFDICGRLLCTAGYHTKIFDLNTATEILDLNHGETVKTTAVIFKPGQDIKSEGKRIWIGNNIGNLQEIDLDTHVTVAESSAHGRKEIIRILRHHKDLWTLDDAGNVFVWPADETGVPNLKYSHTSHRLTKIPTWSMALQDTLWVAAGREIRVHRPGNTSNFDVVRSPLAMRGTGDVTSGTFSVNSGRVYIGHADGKVSIYSLKDYSLVDCIKVSDYKINAMTFVGEYLWAVYKTGKVYVYDVSGPIWKVKKDWKAHAGPATGILLDPSSVWLLGRLQVATIGHDQFVRLWDGLLEDDWIESTMYSRDTEYCTFRQVQAAVTTWNCGAVSPAMLRTDFIADAIHAHERDPPHILVFGFQEVVDLEDRTLTAKSIFAFGKKKEKEKTSDQQYQSRVYREWRDYLASCIRKYIPQHEYTEIHTSSLVGLFSCIFVRTNERRNISHEARQEVKCGMGGHYGNKGALLCRFAFDSSSLCFVNCHLAAGQSQSSNRNNDVATIFESESLPPELDLDLRTSLFVGGGNGQQILDHEICILNGDLNYRIDTIPRDTIIKHITNKDLPKLLDRDQLNLSRRRVAGFRLAPFTELPITFPPTYKYDVGTDRYDSSDKKRSPAWCDRLLYRSSTNRVKQLEYIRHEGVYYSDHRPVSGLFKITIKKVDEAKRRATLKSVNADFARMRKVMLQEGCTHYLVNQFGVKKEEAKILIKGAK